MSYRANGSSGYYPRSNAGPNGQNQRYNAMGSGTANTGDLRHGTNQNRNSQLFMGDLDPSWDENTIREIWRNLGEGNVDIKMMWNNRNGARTHMGFCFVQFPSQAHASNALLKNGVQVPNHPSKTLRLNWSSSSSSYNNNQQSSEISIFVGDLAPNVTEADLFEVFIASYPSTSHVKVVYDQVTGVSKGYAFVKFGSRDDQQRALQEMTGTFVKGRAIRVGSAGHQNQRNRVAPVVDNRSRKFTGPASSPKPSRGHATGTSQFIFPTQQIPPLNGFTDPNNTTIFVKGLPHSVTEQELRASLQPFGRLVYVSIIPDKRSGVAQYVERNAAETAMRKLQGFRIRESKISLIWGKPMRQMEDTPGSYQPHPSLKEPTYGYIPVSDDLALPSGPGATVSKQNPADYDDLNLLPGYSSFQCGEFPTTASGMHSVFDWTPSGSVDSKPHIQSQDHDSFIQAMQSSMDRIEEASNGHLFA